MSQPVFTTSTETDRTGRRYFALIVPIVLAAICLWMAMPKAAVSRGVGFQAANGQPENLSSSVTAVSGSNAIPVSLPAASPKLITRPIEDITPNMRVLASNPELQETLPDSEVTPADWRLVSLTMTKEDGGTLQVQLLRPIEWLATEVVLLFKSTDCPQTLYSSRANQQQAVQRIDCPFHRLLIGQSIYLNLPEPGAQGQATVTAIDLCPPIEAAIQGRRLVTGTFRHSAANVIRIRVESEAEEFGVTDNHPFWSLDRQEFVDAGNLQIGERLQCADGKSTRVEVVSRRSASRQEVYNFEVESEHVYNVGTSGILVHNACPLSIFRSATHGSPSHHSEMVNQARSLLGSPGVTNLRTNQALSDGTRTLSNLRPDVQYIENGLIHIIEVNKTGGLGYGAQRLLEMRASLGSLFGSYIQINI